MNKLVRGIVLMLGFAVPRLGGVAYALPSQQDQYHSMTTTAAAAITNITYTGEYTYEGGAHYHGTFQVTMPWQFTNAEGLTPECTLPMIGYWDTPAGPANNPETIANTPLANGSTWLMVANGQGTDPKTDNRACDDFWSNYIELPGDYGIWTTPAFAPNLQAVRQSGNLAPYYGMGDLIFGVYAASPSNSNGVLDTAPGGTATSLSIQASANFFQQSSPQQAPDYCVRGPNGGGGGIGQVLEAVGGATVIGSMQIYYDVTDQADCGEAPNE